MDLEFDRAKLIALKYLGTDPGKPIRRVIQKLAKANCDRDVIKAVILDLIEGGFLDENLYCQRFVLRHSGLKQKGKSAMRAMLLARGVTRSTVENFLAQQPEDSETIHYYLTEFFQHYSLDEDEEARLYRRLQQRGYNYYTIRRALQEYSEV